jgi:hypothetical protein
VKNGKTIPLTERPTESLQSDSGKGGAPRLAASIASFLSSAVAIVCPACIPAVGSLLAALGLGFAAKEQFIQPLLIALLAVNTAMLVWSARLHRRWWGVGCWRCCGRVGLRGALLLVWRVVGESSRSVDGRGSIDWNIAREFRAEAGLSPLRLREHSVRRKHE